MIEKYIKQISKILNIDVVLNYYLDFGNIHPNEWREFKEDNISKVKSDDGLFLRLVPRIKINPWDYISQFKLIQLPGCCGICISTGVVISSEYQGKGLNIILNQLRQDIARECDYTILMCTDLDNNIPEKKTLLKNGFKDIYQFTNKRTNNLINISLKEL